MQGKNRKGPLPEQADQSLYRLDKARIEQGEACKHYAKDDLVLGRSGFCRALLNIILCAVFVKGTICLRLFLPDMLDIVDP